MLNILLEFSDDFIVCLVHLVHVDAGQVYLRSMLGIMAQTLADDVERNVALARCVDSVPSFPATVDSRNLILTDVVFILSCIVLC